MATYVMSDIHGNLDVFKKMLEKINFKYDGTDKLYLLGDYVDWGPKSLETLLFVMELNKKYDFIITLIGNHDLMFLEQIQESRIHPLYMNYNWLNNNGGDVTYEAFLKLSDEKKDEIELFLDSMPYVVESTVNNKIYLMAHACPVELFEYNDDMSWEDNYYKRAQDRSEAVWTRITRMVPNVIQWFDKNGIYENFICGHTISKYQKDGHFNIIVRKGEYINIDCGCKILGHYNFYEEHLARLACLRLDDFQEFYER